MVSQSEASRSWLVVRQLRLRVEKPSLHTRLGKLAGPTQHLLFSELVFNTVLLRGQCLERRAIEHKTLLGLPAESVTLSHMASSSFEG